MRTQHQFQFFCSLHRSHDLIEGNRLELHVPVGRELGIDGDKVIDAVHFNTVAGVIDQRPLRVFCIMREVTQRVNQLLMSVVQFKRNRIEPDRVQRFGNGAGIALRIR
jgi:hypothetical protein